MNRLGLDYGLKHIGLALATDDHLASPLDTLTNREFEHLSNQLFKLIQMHKVQEIVIGMPEGKIKPKIETFIQQLQPLITIPIKIQAEHYTTKQAHHQAKSAGKSTQKIKAKQHTFAATVILQQFLDANPAPKPLI